MKSADIYVVDVPWVLTKLFVRLAVSVGTAVVCSIYNLHVPKDLSVADNDALIIAEPTQPIDSAKPKNYISHKVGPICLSHIVPCSR